MSGRLQLLKTQDAMVAHLEGQNVLQNYNPPDYGPRGPTPTLDTESDLIIRMWVKLKIVRCKDVEQIENCPFYGFGTNCKLSALKIWEKVKIVLKAKANDQRK